MKKSLSAGTYLIWFSLFITAPAPFRECDEPSGRNSIFKMTSGFAAPDIQELREPEIRNKFNPLNRVCAGVNIHFTTGHEKDLDMIADAGFKYIRMDFVWQRTELRRGIYDWREYDELTANLKKRGLSAIYILDYSNSIYENEVVFKDPITGEEHKGIASPQHPESITAFVNWASSAAEHFNNNDIIWEIWNEPNITFWRPVPDAEQYNKLALATCKAIKTADADSKVIGPATSQIPLDFIESFLDSDILEYLDGVSVHPYRDYSKSPESAGNDFQELRILIDRYSPTGKEKIPIISSEWGYSSAIHGVSTENQAAYIVRMQLANLLNNIPISIWYDWKNDGDEPGNFEHNCGTVTSDLKPKPAYDAIRTLTGQLNGYSLVRRIETDNDNDFLLLFRNDSGNYKLGVWTIDMPHKISTDIIIPGSSPLQATDWRGKRFPIKNDNDRLVLYLTSQLQYITLRSGFRLDL